jgi:LTXXQ motif family protein
MNKIFPIILFFISLNFFAQGEKLLEKREQIKAMKIAFITTELNLTPSEAEKFWPIFNAFDDKQFELRHQKMKTSLKKMDDTAMDKITEKEASAMLAQMEETEEKLFELRKKFIASLKGVLPSIKILKLKKSEENFNKKLLQQYRNKGNKE